MSEQLSSGDKKHTKWLLYTPFFGKRKLLSKRTQGKVTQPPLGPSRVSGGDK